MTDIESSEDKSRSGVNVAFREAREAAGLSQRELASMLGTSAAAIGDIESYEEELFECYSPLEVQLMASTLGTDAATLLKCSNAVDAISGEQLIGLINDRLQTSKESIEAFECRVGWRIRDLLDSPESLLSDLTIDGLQWLCDALQIDWQRVIKGL